MCLLAYAVFGPSRILVLGPDSSLGPMIAATILPLVGADGDPAKAVALASMLALLVAVLMIGAGVAKLGFVADLFSKPTQIGYMNGLALTILVGQLPEALRVLGRRRRVPRRAARLRRGRRDGDTVPAALAVGVGGLAIILVLRQVAPKVPGRAGRRGRRPSPRSWRSTSAARACRWSASCPRASRRSPCPSIDARPTSALLVAGALGITLVSLTDTISTSSAFAARTGQEVDANQEMIGIGAANLAAGLFQGFPVSTSGSRTAVAEQAGRQVPAHRAWSAPSPIAAMLLFVPGLLRNLPQPMLAVGGDRRVALAGRHPGHACASGTSAGWSSPCRWPPSPASPCSACCPASRSPSPSRS